SRPTVDFGQTAIENIFINDFMPNANGEYVKVYLLGHYFASTNSNDASNETIAQFLSMSIKDVVKAWQYWERQGIIAINRNAANHSDHQFDIAFFSIREKYVKERIELPKIDKEKSLKPSEKLIAAISNPHIRRMFEDIEFYARRPLTPQEKVKVLEFIEVYHMDVDMVVKAFYITFEERQIRENFISYAEGIVKNWRDERIFSSATYKKSKAADNAHYQLLRDVCRAMGINQRQIPSEVSATVAEWFDQKGYQTDYILYVVKEATKRTNNPNINYINSIFKSIAEAGETTKNAAKHYFENKQIVKKNTKSQGNKVQRTKFQNFNHRATPNLDDVIKKKANKNNR
ncbi:MAG: hypothetical protein CSB19_02410, partial [Clostridiales bacterium]